MNESELRELLAKLHQQADAQKPYFDDRLLQKIEQVEALLPERQSEDE